MNGISVRNGIMMPKFAEKADSLCLNYKFPSVRPSQSLTAPPAGGILNADETRESLPPSDGRLTDFLSNINHVD